MDVSETCANTNAASTEIGKTSEVDAWIEKLFDKKKLDETQVTMNRVKTDFVAYAWEGAVERKRPAFHHLPGLHNVKLYDLKKAEFLKVDVCETEIKFDNASPQIC